MGRDSSAPRPSKSLASIARGLKDSYPSIVQSLGEQEAPAARYSVATQEEIAPREQKLSADLFSRFAPQYGEAGSQLDLGALRGAGGEAVMEADRLDRLIDPEFYRGREETSGKLSQLLSGIDPNRLTGSERENVARGIARSRPGESAVPSNQGAIEAALTYGGALDQKRNTVANVINTAAGTIPSFRSGKDAFGQATGGARFGVNPFSSGTGFGGTSQVAGQEGGQNTLGMLGGFQNLRTQLQANKRDTWDKINEGFSSSICCFIFMEAYSGKLPESVRTCRDYWYNNSTSVKEGYKRMAKWLVPLMRKSVIIRAAVNNLMIKPLTRICEWRTCKTEVRSSLDMFIRDTWFKIWEWYGTDNLKNI